MESLYKSVVTVILPRNKKYRFFPRTTESIFSRSSDDRIWLQSRLDTIKYLMTSITCSLSIISEYLRFRPDTRIRVHLSKVFIIPKNIRIKSCIGAVAKTYMFHDFFELNDSERYLLIGLSLISRYFDRSIQSSLLLCNIFCYFWLSWYESRRFFLKSKFFANEARIV